MDYNWIFYIALVAFNLLVLSMVYQMEKCKCLKKSGYLNEKFWYLFNKVRYIKLMSMVFIVVGIINLCLPVTSSLSKIIFVGNLLAIVIVVALILQIHILIDFLKKVNECEKKKKCTMNSFHGILKNILISCSAGTQFIIIIAILMGCLYL